MNCKAQMMKKCCNFFTQENRFNTSGILKFRMIYFNGIGVFLMSAILFSCAKENKSDKKYLTENVIIVVMDGPRYSETWGDSTHQYIPRMANDMAQKGGIHTSFYNEGVTYTMPGHTAITTGIYQEINNGGGEMPLSPSIFQTWRKFTNNPAVDTQIIASKDKLEVLSNCIDPSWRDLYQPYTDCGVNGLGTGYRKDSITFLNTMNALVVDKPKLLLVNFRAPDSNGHNNDWEGYLQAIKDVDQYIFELFNFIEQDAYYKDKTTFFVTNDHGRHLDTVADGFKSHGDSCEGCKHINLFSYGPDFNTDVIYSTRRDLLDISATIEELLYFPEKRSTGNLMEELLLER